MSSFWKKLTTKTPAVNKLGRNPMSDLVESTAGKILQVDNLGINGDNIAEGVPNVVAAPSEKILRGRNNSFIILGRDRPSTLSSGYGGIGDTHAGRIDIVVGMLAHKAASHGTLGEPIHADPNMSKDAARIYMSQKTDVDKNFKLARGRVGTSRAKSGIAIKADAVRVIGREGIKLVTRSERINSQGSNIISVPGVDIIAGNDDSDLQPMVKGDNLSQCLDRLATHLVALNGILDTFLITQMRYNKALANHFHNSPFFAAPTTPAFRAQQEGIRTVIKQLTKVKRSLLTHKDNVGKWNTTYLQQGGGRYINSRYNNVN